MNQSFFNGLSGLFAFTRALQTVSNNVSNMNTPGFRGSDSFFQSLNGGGGHGVQLLGEGIRMNAGQSKATSTPTDLSLDGSGFFILQAKDGSTFYTRAGHFSFDSAGYLIDPGSKSRVAGLDAQGNLTDINISDLKTLPAAATTSLKLSGTLPTGRGKNDSNFSEALEVKGQDFSVFDETGATHTISVSFIFDDRNPPPPGASAWTIMFKDSLGKDVGHSFLMFDPEHEQHLVAGSNLTSISLNINGKDQVISIDMGTDSTGLQKNGAPGDNAKATTAVVTGSEDGHAASDLISVDGGVTFDEKGVIQLNYGNGETRKGPQIALAQIEDQSQLRYDTGSLFEAPADLKINIGKAGDAAFGKIRGSSLELANVDLTQEFGDLLILQRGYQASSRVMTVSNDMIEQLYNSMNH